MTFYEACQSCREGNFVTNASFDSSQSMHEYNYTLYYEDGAALTHHLDYIQSQAWAKDGWYIKYSANKVDIDKLSQMHKNNRGFMLQDGSYEDCINR
jgi:hypothetical protein